MTHEQAKRKLVKQVAAIIGTLAECGTGSPESMLYLGLGCTLADWNGLKGLLIASDMIAVEHNYVTLTTKGVTLGAKINAAQTTTQS